MVVASTSDINQFFFQGVVSKTQRLLFFLDTAKAFDSIDHTWALKVLSKVGFPSCVTRFISSSLSDVKVAPSFGNNVSIWIDILRGVKQGCPLSPLIFILAYDLSTLPNIKCFAFADDLAMSALHVSDISPALTIISTFSTLSGLGINKDNSCVISNEEMSQVRLVQMHSLLTLLRFHYLLLSMSVFIKQSLFITNTLILHYST